MTCKVIPFALAAAIVAGYSIAQQPTQTIETKAPEKLQTKYLPNALRIHDKVISGGLPEGDVAFRELQALGVKTIISVDGAKPDVATARKFGLRYVHMPHGYDGIPDKRVKELAKAVHDLEGPIYIHCHHGKHRSPAAAAVACVGSGLLPPSGALAILRLAGTSENYQGLYRAAEQARPLDEQMLAALKVEYREKVAIPPLAEAMVDIEHIHDRLKKIAAAGWQPPTHHPDVVPAHEALMLREQFMELARTDAVRRQPEKFRQLMQEGETATADLEAALHNASQPSQDASKIASAAFDRVTASCTSCHKEFRDVPLGDKSR